MSFRKTTRCVAKLEGPLAYRLVLSVAAISFLWISSLAVALKITSYVIHQPWSRSVYDYCEYAYDATTITRDGYKNCVQRQAAQCNVDLEAAVETASTKVATAIAENAQRLQSYETIHDTCASALVHAQEAIDDWSSDNVVPYTCPHNETGCDKPCGNSSTCSCKRIENLFGDVSGIRNQLYATSEAFAFTSVETVDEVSNYFEARSAYDAEYLKNKTKGLQTELTTLLEDILLPYVAVANLSFGPLFPGADLVVACVSLRNDTSEQGCVIQDARDLFDDYTTLATYQFNSVLEWGTMYMEEAADFSERVDTAFDNMITFYEGVVSWIEDLNVDLPTGDWFDLGLKDFFAFPALWPLDVSVGALPSADTLYPESLAEIYSRYLKNLTIASDLTMQRALTLKNHLITAVPEIVAFSDYNPPKYNPNISATHAVSAAAFAKDQADALKELNQDIDDDDDDLLRVEDDDVFQTNTNASSLVSVAKSRLGALLSDWESLSGSDYDSKLVFRVVTLVTSILLLVDYIWRGYQSLQTLHRYLHRSAVDVPWPDMRIDGDEGASFRMLLVSPHSALARIIFSPQFSALVALSLTIVVAAAVARAYVPTYRNYVDICVDGKGTAENGTFLARNVYSISYNYAAQRGHRLTAEALDAYDARRADECAQLAFEADQTNSLSKLAVLKASHFSTATDVSLALECFNTTALDTAWGCCPGCDDDSLCPRIRDGTLAFPVSTYLGDAACQVDDWTLEESLFDCADDIPECTLTCGGPNKEILRGAAQRCACTLEYWIHAGVLKGTVGFLVFLLMNVSRLLLVSALGTLYWRLATPNVYTFLSTCDDDGACLPNHDPKFRNNLQDDLRARIRSWEALAYLKLLLATAVHIPWIVLLAGISNNIEYDPFKT